MKQLMITALALLSAALTASAQSDEVPRAWMQFRLDTTQHLTFLSDPLPGGITFGLDSDGRLLVSSGSGQPWQLAANPFPGKVPTIIAGPAGSGMIFARASGEDVVQSEDNGVTWKPAMYQEKAVKVIAPLGGGFVVADEFGVITVTDTGVRSLPRSGMVSAIAVQAQSGRIAIGYFAYRNSEEDCLLFESADRGATWGCAEGANESRLPDNPVFSVAYQDSLLLAGTADGLYSRTVNGSWQKSELSSSDAAALMIPAELPDGRQAMLVIVETDNAAKLYIPDDARQDSANSKASARSATTFACTPVMTVMKLDRVSESSLVHISSAAHTATVRVKFPNTSKPEKCQWTWDFTGGSGDAAKSWVRVLPATPKLGPQDLSITIQANRGINPRSTYLRANPVGSTNTAQRDSILISQNKK